ncbi:PAS domain-containing sensor histidine kinase [Dyadobacter luticola]|uniref:histidine kinase n=1 Tax=Dyadobacter luticola TaxID=1979387 RepID=A0A5R9KVY4_9BACT|nr:ATP-binding protein [Dyadobacter luticola]TLV00423.1 hypothetical protein FEN17_13115 [Dyadobacter luticola]
MYILTKLTLSNDLDLMLAHKRSMQVADYGGIGIIQQTSFATAVSEVCRLMLDKESRPCMYLGVLKSKTGRSCVYARITDPRVTSINIQNPNLVYARKLVHGFTVEDDAITLICEMPTTVRLSKELIANGQKLFEELPAVTPYEEAKRLNDQLQEMANRLGESEKKYQVLTDSLPLMMFTVRSDGQMLFANEGFMHFAGTRAFEQLNWLTWLADRQSGISISRILEKMKTGEAFSLEISLKQSLDENRWHLLSMNPIENPLTGQVDWSGFLVNIHAQKLVEETLRDNEELRHIRLALETRQKELDLTVANLNRSNQELAKFAYVASHDLQEPARKMVVFSDMLLSKYHDSLPADGAGILKRIKTGSERMVAVIRDLLDYSKISIDRHIEIEPVQLTQIVQQAREQLEAQIADSGAEVRLDNDLTFMGNKQLLALLFQNLIGNAIKFVEKDIRPEIVISAQQVRLSELKGVNLDPNWAWTSISVTDNGIGFDERFLERIFEMFQRLHSQDQYKGTGIGLAICKRIAEMHRGQLIARSKVSKGSVFTIYLPNIKLSEH